MKLTPGKYTIMKGIATDAKRRKNKEITLSREGEKVRRQSKEEKFKTQISCEVQEGPTYATGFALFSEDDIHSIPAATVAPQPSEACCQVKIWQNVKLS